MSAIDYSNGTMARYAARESLKYGVRRAIFCPGCNSVMDVRRAVQITVETAPGEIAFLQTLCTKCAARIDVDEIGPDLAKRLDRRIDIEWLDGRSLFGRSKKRHPSSIRVFTPQGEQ